MADSNLVNLTEDSSPGLDSVVYTVDDPAGTPADRKATVDNVLAANDARTKTLTNTTIDADATGNSLTNIDAAKIQGVDVDATQLASPSDGDILVYRSGGSDFVLEPKPAAGSNPAAADITDATADGIALITSADANPFTDADETKLDGIEAAADVTDTANVTAAGALMDSEVTNLAAVKAFDSADYATAAQGTTADSALQPTDIATGTITPRADDIDLSGGSDGDVLTVQADGSLAPEAPSGGGASQLSDLSDVNTSTATNRNVLVGDGTDFESRALVEADISDLGDYLTDSSASTLTNKTIDGDNNTITNIALGAEASGALTDLSDVDTDKSKTPADGDVLTFDGTDWNAEASPGGGGGGQTLYDYVLDAGGNGDYTDFSTAVAAMSSGETLFVAAGTYTETSPITLPATNITIIGAGPWASKVVYNASSDNDWTQAGLRFINMGLEVSGTREWNFQCDDMQITGCVFTLSNTSGFASVTFNGDEGYVSDNIMRYTGASDRDEQFKFAMDNGVVTGNQFELSRGTNSSNNGAIQSTTANSTFSNNTIRCLNQSSAGPVLAARGAVSNNTLQCPTASTGIDPYNDESVITGNRILGAGTGITIPNNLCIVSNNYIAANGATTGVGINVNSTSSVISNNVIRSGSSGIAIDLNQSDYCTVTGNSLYYANVGVQIDSGGDNNTVMGNTHNTNTTDITNNGSNNIVDTGDASGAYNAF